MNSEAQVRGLCYFMKDEHVVIVQEFIEKIYKLDDRCSKYLEVVKNNPKIFNNYHTIGLR